MENPKEPVDQPVGRTVGIVAGRLVTPGWTSCPLPGHETNRSNNR